MGALVDDCDRITCRCFGDPEIDEVYHLARRIMITIAPVVGGHTTATTIEAMATAFVSTLADSQNNPHETRRVLHDFIRRVLHYSEGLP